MAQNKSVTQPKDRGGDLTFEILPSLEPSGQGSCHGSCVSINYCVSF